MSPNTDRGNAALLNSNRQGLDAKLHQGYDANPEHRNQSNLLSNLQFGQGVTAAAFAEVAPGAALGAVQNDTSSLTLNNFSQNTIQGSPFAFQLNNEGANANVLGGNIGAQALSDNGFPFTGAGAAAAVGGNPGTALAAVNNALASGLGLGAPALPSVGGTPPSNPTPDNPIGPTLGAPVVVAPPTAGTEDHHLVAFRG